MSAHLVIVRNPFHPSKDREQKEVDHGQSLAALTPKSGIFVLFRNDEVVLRRDYEQQINDGDIVAIVFLPRGGGGGGSNPLKIVLSIALTMVVPGIGDALAWKAFDAGLISDIVGFNLVSSFSAAGVSLQGGFHINVLGVRQ